MEYLDHIDGKPTFSAAMACEPNHNPVRASPNLSVEQPFYLVVNLMSAKDLGFAKPRTLRCRPP
jgi:hypothetical protein